MSVRSGNRHPTVKAYLDPLVGTQGWLAHKARGSLSTVCGEEKEIAAIEVLEQLDVCRGTWNVLQIVRSHKGRRADSREGHNTESPTWSGQRGSNPRPSAWEADALPTELCPRGARL